jgi:hypothetical protein
MDRITYVNYVFISWLVTVQTQNVMFHKDCYKMLMIFFKSCFPV